MVFLRFSFFLLLLGGCATSSSYKNQTAIDVLIGYDDAYSSTSGILSRDMCTTDAAIVKFHLTEEQLAKIGARAESTDFFKLPRYISAVSASNDTITVTSPCAEFSLDIYHRGQHHRVTWDCDATSDGSPPPQVAETFNAVINALAPALEDLPASGCRYY
jgi:hypothetical protein